MRVDASSNLFATVASQRNQQAQVLRQQQQVVRELAARDREVRAHEQAHAAVGGVYAGAPVYQFTKGPNGVRYAVSGQVSIDVSEVPGDPQATLDKMLQVARAALAPAQPSPQDRAVAAEAAVKAQQARTELSREGQTAAGDSSRPAGQNRAAGGLVDITV